MPEAQVDRFLVQLRLGYPRREHEVQMLRAHGVATPRARRVLDAEAIQRLQSIAARIFVEEDLYEYAVSLAEYTRRDARVALGASPRATLGLLRAARARAVLAGRAFLTPDDLKGVAPAVLSHRLVVSNDFADEASARQAVVDAALRDVPYRRAVRPV